MGKIKRTKAIYEEAKPYQKYRRKNNGFNSISGLANSIFALAIASVGLTIVTSSLRSSGVLEDDSQSTIRLRVGNDLAG
jgi:hypothetical protein